jgi:hypothetical protein
MMFNPVIVDVAKIVQRERLEEAASQPVFERGAVSDPIERGAYIKAWHRQLREELQGAENRRRRREALASRAGLS